MHWATDITWNSEILEDFMALADGMEIKAPVAALMAAFAEWIGMDKTLLLMALSLLLIETVLRIAFHLKRRRSRICRAMQKSIARFFYYFTTLAIVLFVESTIAHSYGVTIPLADAVLGMLMLTEMTSVISFLRLLGYKPPVFVDGLIVFWKKKFQAKVMPPADFDKD